MKEHWIGVRRRQCGSDGHDRGCCVEGGGEAQGVIPEHLMAWEVGHEGLTKLLVLCASPESTLLTSLLLPVWANIYDSL
jgi:hypothetical protein